MNLIKERDARTKKRQRAKRKLDKDITLALSPVDTDKRCMLALNKSEGKVRLLDEGAIVMADGGLDLYIKKNTIKKYVTGNNKKLTPRYLYGDMADDYFESPDEPMNLDDKYEGTINIGHQRFATFPFIVGKWKQEDLSIAKNEDGRKGLDVDLKLNEAHPLVQALRVQDIPVGVSVEMYLHIDDKATEEETQRRNEFTPIVDEIFIADFAIVGECGNVGSSGSVDLQGVKMEDSVKDIEEVVDEESELEEVAEENEMPTEDVKDTEDVTEDEESESEEEDEEEEEPAEDESVDEEVSDEVEDEEDEEAEDEEDALAVAEETINSLKSEIEKLKSQVEALKKSNNKKDKKIKENAEKNEAFVNKFKGLSVNLGLTKEVKEKKDVSAKLYATGDGIGE